MVPRPPALGVRRQRQQGEILFKLWSGTVNRVNPPPFLVVPCPAAGVEQLQPSPRAAVQRPPGGSEGHRLVPPPTRAAGVGGRHRRPLPALLEHSDGSGAAEHGHWLAGLQPGVVQTRQRAGED